MSKFTVIAGFLLVATAAALFPDTTAQAGVSDGPLDSGAWFVRIAGLGLILTALHAMDLYIWPSLATRNNG